MTVQDRMATALMSIAAATGVQRMRGLDAAAAERNGTTSPEVEVFVLHLEAMAKDLWSVADRPSAGPG